MSYHQPPISGYMNPSSSKWQATFPHTNLQANRNNKRKLPLQNEEINQSATKKNKNSNGVTETRSSLPPGGDFLTQMSALLDNKLEPVIGAIKGVNDQVGIISQKVDTHDKILSGMDSKVNELEQAKLNMQLEISGLNVPLFVDYYRIKTLFLQYAESIKVFIEPSDIVDAYVRERRFGNDKKKVIVMTFVHEAAKNRVLKQKINHDRESQSSTNIFFNNVLTPANHSLMMAARKLKKSGKLIHAWTMSGSIFVIRNIQEGRIKVECHDHLLWLVNSGHSISGNERGLANENASLNEESVAAEMNVHNDTVIQVIPQTPTTSGERSTSTPKTTLTKKSSVVNGGEKSKDEI